MIIKDLFKKPIDRSIQGVVTIGNENDEQKKMELEEYVCTDEITKQFRIFFRKYSQSITTPTEKMAAWITGFFGSGKSHFLKILGYILENEKVAGLSAVDYFKDKIDDQMLLADMQKSASINNKVVLFNIDSKAKSDSKNKTQAIMDIMLRTFNESIGYCGSSPWVADLERMLDDEGLLESFISKFEELSHRNWKNDRAKAALNKRFIVQALSFARNVPQEDAETFINQQINEYTISTDEFAKIVNEYCKKNKTRVIFLMDEVGQFIGNNTQLMLNLQTCVEDLGKYCQGKAWVVITSQQELSAMIDSTKDKQQDFSKIQARFDTRILLSGAEAGEVIKKRILDKKDTAVTPLKSLYDTNGAKLSNLIMFDGAPSWSGYKDSEEFKDVYPFVPYQFELLQKVFTAIREHGMSEGKHLAHSERSLLSAFQDSAKKYAVSNEGLLVPFDSFYSTIEQFIDYDIKGVFSSAEKKATLGEFDLRVLRVLFMILHVKEMPATLNRICTLMVESIDEDKMELKARISESLVRLEKETFIQKNGDTYDFLTNAEQDVNKQINNVTYNEGEVKRTVFEIVYEKILELTKLRYKNRYDFSLNRYVDDDAKGITNNDNITIKILTQYSNISGETSLSTESLNSNALIADLTQGDFITELIKANKITIFKRNNSGTMSVAMTEILSKKSAEASERIKRAEDIIKESLRTADLYYNGSKLDIKEKDGKDRVLEALNKAVSQEYQCLDYVSYYYNEQKEILALLNDTKTYLFGYDITNDANYKAYLEIFKQIKNDKNLQITTTVKSLCNKFSKRPYGWRELDVLGMLAVLFKVEEIQIFIHGALADINDYSFKSDFVRKNGIDTMVVKKQEKVSDEVLYKVKNIMMSVYGQVYSQKESELKNDVLDFFNKKKKFLSDLKIKYGSKPFPGNKLIPNIISDIEAIVKSNDSNTIFNEIINRKDSLEDNVDYLEQLETFYKEGSSQQKVFQEAYGIVTWYDVNKTLFTDLDVISNTIDQMYTILKMDIPFNKMTELGNLVFEAKEIKDKIFQDKLDKTIKFINEDKEAIKKEYEAVMNSECSDKKKDIIKDKYENIEGIYSSWNNKLNINAPNLDSYVVSSQNALSEFKLFIQRELVKIETPTQPASSGSKEPASEPKTLRTKNIKIINCVPVAKKTIKTKEDINSVIEYIKKELEKELDSNDEINLD